MGQTHERTVSKSDDLSQTWRVTNREDEIKLRAGLRREKALKGGGCAWI